MYLNLSWLNYRKRLLISSFLDFIIIYICFFLTFKNFITNEFILFLIILFNANLWIIGSYILGRYSKISRSKLILFLNQTYKTILNLFINVLFSQVIFRFYWDWDYMKFDSFSVFTNIFLLLYIKVF